MSAEIFNFSKIYDYNSYQKYATNFKVTLGKGTKGSVSKVWINNTLPIAVKKIILSKEKDGYTKEIADLEKETNLLMNMNHSNIMKVYFRFPYINDETNQRIYYIGMELAPIDLEQVLKQKKKLSQYEISQLASQLSSALGYLESMNVAHRDIKPANILVTENGSYKLCDFSEYKWFDQTLKTSRNTLTGTPNYLSPELKRFFVEFQDEIEQGLKPCNKLNYNAFKSDVFSFGLVLLACHGVNIWGLNLKEGELKTKLKDNCTKEMKFLLEKCLTFNPKDRILFRDISQYLRLDIIQASHQLMSFVEQQQKQKDQLNQLQSQETIIKQLTQQSENDNAANNQLKKEKQLQNQEILKLKDEISQLKLKLGSQSFQQGNSGLQQQSTKPIQKHKENQEIYDKCYSNQELWENQSQAWRQEQFTKNTKGLQWIDKYNKQQYDNKYDNWNDKTGQTQRFSTYWRSSFDGRAWSVFDQDIPKAIEIVNKLANTTGYEFGLCLMMLHSNLWNFEKSVNDLMN